MIYISNSSYVLYLLSSIIYSVTLIYASIQDAKYHRIPDKVHIVIVILAVLQGVHLPGFFVVSIPMLFIAVISKGGFGGGDIKLSAVCGLYLGVRNVINGSMIAVLLAGVYIVIRFIGSQIGKKQFAETTIMMTPIKRKDQIAFGPYLAAGYILTAFFGNQISNWFF